MSNKILIFPAGMPKSLEFLDQMIAEGRNVIGSSSLGYDPAKNFYPQWVHLPYITAPEFEQSLIKAVKDHCINEIFTPNIVVWNYLNNTILNSLKNIKLINKAPLETESIPYKKALDFSNSLHEQSMPLATTDNPEPLASKLELAALFRHAETIHGMCDHEKIRALCEIFRHTPNGDIIEIGSWWGKSAFVLLWLSKCYKIGKILCVDPWKKEYLAQDDEKQLVDDVGINIDEALTIFKINLLPYASGAINYLRSPSVDASHEYRHCQSVCTETFGKTIFMGKIAILHIDGNHNYDNAHADITSWADLVIPGGWIIIDDYIWPYGDGPRRAGDDFLNKNSSKIEVSFTMGSALFMRISKDDKIQ